MPNLNRVPNKLAAGWDWDSSLKLVWRSDTARPWDTYSKDTFRRFWDDRYSVVEGNRR